MEAGSEDDLHEASRLVKGKWHTKRDRVTGNPDICFVADTSHAVTGNKPTTLVENKSGCLALD